jgi:hypothetical protein
MAKNTTVITPSSTVESKRYLDMLFSSMSCTLSPEGSSILVPVWELSQEENFLENTLRDSFRCRQFSPPTIVENTLWLGHSPAHMWRLGCVGLGTSGDWVRAPDLRGIGRSFGPMINGSSVRTPFYWVLHQNSMFMSPSILNIIISFRNFFYN